MSDINILSMRESLLKAMNLLVQHEDSTYDADRGEACGLIDEVFQELGKLIGVIDERH